MALSQVTRAKNNESDIQTALNELLAGDAVGSIHDVEITPEQRGGYALVTVVYDEADTSTTA